MKKLPPAKITLSKKYPQVKMSMRKEVPGKITCGKKHPQEKMSMKKIPWQI